MKPLTLPCLVLLLIVGLTSPAMTCAQEGDYVTYFSLPGTPAGGANSNTVPLQAAWYANTSPNPQGGVLMVGADLVTDRIHDNIAYQLSRHGWSTLIIQLPDPAATPDPAETDSSAAQTAPRLLSDAEYLRAAVTHMQTSRNLYNLVLLNTDSGWQRLQSASTPAALANFQGYILFKVDSPGTLTPLSQTAPILDLVDRFSAGSYHRERKLSAQQNRLNNYSTVELTETGWQMQPRVERFSRRIRGWLRVNLQGMELNGG